MTYLWDDPANFADDALTGFCELHADLVRQVPGGAVRRGRPERPKVAVLPGGGSGHYPAFYGVIGPGLADGAVSGNLFTSPSAQDACSVARAAHSGAGVVFSYGNYAGDVMNFGLAADRLRSEGVEVEHVVVTDDIASAPAEESERRRGIAGDFTVFKLMGAAAEEGAELAEVVRIGRKTNGRTRTIGTAFAGCSFPGAAEPLFQVPDGHMGLGLGIHGEPGLRDVPLPSAAELAEDFVARVLAEKPDGAGGRVAVLLNGLGAVKHEELLVLWRHVAARLRDSGHVPVLPEVGELVTSLDMAGVSLTLTWLDDELERLWTAPAWTPAFRRGHITEVRGEETVDEPEAETVGYAPAADSSRRLAEHVVAALRRVETAVRDAEDELGAIDTVAGDGDHGRGMVRGVSAAVEAAERAQLAGAGAGDCLAAAGDGWADRAGGTSGVLWGAGLRAAGEVLGEHAGDAEIAAKAVDALATRIRELGGAEVGDKTLVDALEPFRAALLSATTSSLVEAWGEAATAADRAARDSARLVPRKGRARPLAERSVGTPDPGAVSFALITKVIGDYLTGAST
ncbi:dihydroxyacetone kinase family protein [Saccharopolyspora sp. TS4A08]|uniref:Dihydroxyacetone kinase family protein n=1 Tax=Saccharopolyspora ipomoeae TaxID=3042027 RepID=A0ABT6PQL4_9PSEU|nr:dihydroxyacetone kinase family protein [Saccharopolyspora sp. TS4A08]MDI2030135.1 dihydroxyacetone kinase family protein [Saccharopolyspora sp. TS4A08]